MTPHANVTSVEALDLFRSQLIVYLEKASGAVSDVLDDVGRTRGWLQNDQRALWEGQARRRMKDLETARQELSTAELCNLGAAVSGRSMAVNKAKRSLSEAHDKLDRLKKWSRNYDNEVAMLVKQVEKLGDFLATDLRQATAHLSQVINALDAYSDRAGFLNLPPAVQPDAARNAPEVGEGKSNRP